MRDRSAPSNPDTDRGSNRTLRTDCATAVNLILDATAPWVDYDMIPNWLYDPILDTV